MIHINVTCDHISRRDEPGALAFRCNAAIGVGFDSLTETFGDLVVALRGIGWHVETEGESRQAKCLCPEHAPRERY